MGLLLLTTGFASATMLHPVAFDEKVDQAESIMVARCIAQSASYDQASDWILTRSTFRIERTLKGPLSQEITVVTPGGVANGVAQEVIGVPKFNVGSDHVLFVRNSTAGPTVAFLEQGAYRVVKNDHGDRVVRSMITSPVVIDNGRGTTMLPEPPRLLRDFENDVRQRVRERETLRMEMLEKKRREETSIMSRLKRNAPLVALALIGMMLATWQIVRKW